LAWGPTREILRVGLVSAVVCATTNITVAVATGFVAIAGSSAVAGYGTGARLEYLLVPLVFGIGAPLGAMVGTAVGAGDVARARRVAWTGACAAGLATEVIGVAAAVWPEAWLRLFDADPAMLSTGILYLRLVGPFYGFAGIGLALYFAAQGAGRVGWPLAAGLLRLVVATGGGWLALRLGAGPAGIFFALSAGLVGLATVNVLGILTGRWLAARRAPAIIRLPLDPARTALPRSTSP
jgi:Na+-driven multidrug efflux pump